MHNHDIELDGHVYDTRLLFLDPPGNEVHGPVLSRLDGGQVCACALVLAPDQDASDPIGHLGSSIGRNESTLLLYDHSMFAVACRRCSWRQHRATYDMALGSARAHTCEVQQSAVFLHRHLLTRTLEQHPGPLTPDELTEILRRELPPEPED